MLTQSKEQKIPRERARSYDEGYHEAFVEDEVTDEEPKFGSKTNVWGVGVCMYKLMTLIDSHYLFYGKVREFGEVIPEIETKREPEYSEDLRDMVHQCLYLDPDKRPSWSDLLQRINHNRFFFRNWDDPQKVPQEAVLKYTREAWDEMAFGTWKKRNENDSDTPPESYASVGIDSQGSEASADD